MNRVSFIPNFQESFWGKSFRLDLQGTVSSGLVLGSLRTKLSHSKVHCSHGLAKSDEPISTDLMKWALGRPFLHLLLCGNHQKIKIEDLLFLLCLAKTK